MKHNLGGEKKLVGFEHKRFLPGSAVLFVNILFRRFDVDLPVIPSEKLMLWTLASGKLFVFSRQGYSKVVRQPHPPPTCILLRYAEQWRWIKSPEVVDQGDKIKSGLRHFWLMQRFT